MTPWFIFCLPHFQCYQKEELSTWSWFKVSAAFYLFSHGSSLPKLFQPPYSLKHLSSPTNFANWEKRKQICHPRPYDISSFCRNPHQCQSLVMRIDEDGEVLCLINYCLEYFEVANSLEHQVDSVSCTIALEDLRPLLMQHFLGSHVIGSIVRHHLHHMIHPYLLDCVVH